MSDTAAISQRVADIQQRIADVRQRIAAAALRFGRDPAAVRLVAVSKTRQATMVRAANDAGLVHFGENYVQEGVAKVAELAALPLCWHFVGPIQSNKTRAIAEHFAWVHSVDRVRIAERLDRQRPAERDPLAILLQVNISGEASKAGVDPDDLPALAAAVARLPRLQLRGLMALPAPAADLATQREPFARLRELLATTRKELGERGALFDQLSMGMSDDLEAAIAEGATLVRVGTAIFGPRAT